MTPLRSRAIRLAHQNPHLRPDLLPLLKTAITGFHGSHLPGLPKIIPDPEDRKVMSSLGTWATLSKDHTLIYGDHVYEVEIPEGRGYLDATGIDNFDVFWFDRSLIMDYLNPKSAKALASPAGEPVLEYFLTGSQYPNFESMKPAMAYQMRSIFNEVQAIIYRNWNYLKKWRARRQNWGYDGVVWHNSKIDIGPDRPHTVYLVWGDLKVVRELTREEVSMLSNPRGR